jgi:hypothetical protein
MTNLFNQIPWHILLLFPEIILLATRTLPVTPPEGQVFCQHTHISLHICRSSTLHVNETNEVQNNSIYRLVQRKGEIKRMKTQRSCSTAASTLPSQSQSGTTKVVLVSCVSRVVSAPYNWQARSRHTTWFRA